ncbi:MULTISPECIES: azurin [Pseudomonas]|uniref:Azurin n=1 Tax=Pseudomonas quercus TaxID=2722792 RepID=A0ABX0YB94_9PSED|nr:MULTISPECIES: azurin [Pseudomonas]MBF7142061.1 azurin [Pseudomonas sp. LY10J]NJP00599.1 azurin [Pseudomonas quercus]
MLWKALFASLLSLAAVPALADECKVTVDSTDQMTFDQKQIEVSKSCKTFEVTLTHSGNLPVNVMGHNWVLTKTADMREVASDGMSAGADKGYLKPEDTRVIAHTRMIGAGEKDSITFDASTLDPAGQYTFFCSFPGHIAMMQGTLKIVD